MIGVHLYIGKRGAGKSRFMRSVVNHACKDRLFLVHDLLGDWQNWEMEGKKNVYLFQDKSADEVAEIALLNKPCTIVYDELRVALPNYGSLDTITHDILTYGRHYEIAIMGATQRPALISPTFRALTTRAFIFSVTNAKDLKYLEDNFDGLDTEKVKNLEPLQFITWPD